MDLQLLHVRLDEVAHPLENMAARAAETITTSPNNTAKHLRSPPQFPTVTHGEVTAALK